MPHPYLYPHKKNPPSGTRPDGGVRGNFAQLRAGSRFGFERLFRAGDDGRERRGVLDGDIGEDLAIRFDAGGFQAFDEARVGDALGADGGVDALRPQATELTLAALAVAILVGLRLADSVLGITEEFRAESAETLGSEQHALATLAAGR